MLIGSLSPCPSPRANGGGASGSGLHFPAMSLARRRPGSASWSRHRQIGGVSPARQLAYCAPEAVAAAAPRDAIKEAAAAGAAGAGGAAAPRRPESICSEASSSTLARTVGGLGSSRKLLAHMQHMYHAFKAAATRHKLGHSRSHGPASATAAVAAAAPPPSAAELPTVTSAPAAAMAVTAAVDTADVTFHPRRAPVAAAPTESSLGDSDGGRLYKGANSAVYKAVCNRSGLPVALKVYFMNRVPEAVLHMLCREIEIHAAAVHPNIIALYGAFQTEKHLVMVMEYAARGDLFGLHRSMPSRRLNEQGLMELVVKPLLDALSYLHRRGICHRDIKPENVFFTSDWRLKLGDFGVSINLARERAVTRAGTACYMAPEVSRCPLKYKADDNKDDPALAYGTACDIWGVGILAYELLVGFTPLTPVNHNGAAISAKRALIFPSGASEACRDFVAWALSERPEDRPTALQLSCHPWLRPSETATGVPAAPAALTAAPAAPAPGGPKATKARVLRSDSPDKLLPGEARFLLRPAAESPSIRA
ncbi:hypothetical protein GPECTOR_47g318 [Gonium pectorale]|uniref:Protein kinase domain-containing protein n=1 Tax=Gonium pectorale TaxID=33097 RepID=A0A150G8E7_GONPE|nr:hypothetical protein GPECTOR_47g318 [Gonium pectorale]|eukprot:KXZ46043.1 hypothetical protein GPECTOR_47g318 [Gonium pectorale]